jgi:hypothetical protein
VKVAQVNKGTGGANGVAGKHYEGNGPFKIQIHQGLRAKTRQGRSRACRRTEMERLKRDSLS